MNYDAHLILVGKTISNMVAVELQLLNLCVALISDDRKIGLTIVADEHFASLARLARKLAWNNFEDDDATREAVLAWVKQAEEAQKRRNKVAHTPWLVPFDDTAGGYGYEMVLTAKKGRLIEADKPYDPDALQAGVTEIFETLEAFLPMRRVLRSRHPKIDARLAKGMGTIEDQRPST